MSPNSLTRPGSSAFTVTTVYGAKSGLSLGKGYEDAGGVLNDQTPYPASPTYPHQSAGRGSAAQPSALLPAHPTSPRSPPVPRHSCRTAVPLPPFCTQGDRRAEEACPYLRQPVLVWDSVLSLNHRWLCLEGTSGCHLLKPPCSGRAT